MNKYGLKITYSWGDEEPLIMYKTKDAAWKEAKMLASKGIKELIVIAQDTTKYGVDIYGEPRLPELLQALSEIPEIHWIRFLYSYRSSNAF